MVYASREEKESVYCLKATKTPPPVVVAVIFGNRLLCHVLAVGAVIPAPLCSGNYVRASLRTPTLHYTFIHASTSAPHGFGSLLPFHSASFIYTVSHYPSHFPTHFQRLPSFLRRVCPNKMNPFDSILEWLLFQKDSNTNTTRTF